MRKYLFRNSAASGHVRTAREFRGIGFLAVVMLACLGLMLPVAMAQSGGQGAISGTVTDATGALIPNAVVVAHNDATGVDTKRTASSGGLYNISPLLPGTYTVTVTADGFSTFKQEKLIVDALSNVGLNVSLKTGSQNEMVTVTDTPPALETTNSTLGGTISNNVYMALPLLISGSQQRDVTQFSNLLPGAQVNPGGRSSIIGGTGQRLGELYLDGLPLTTLSQQGDNRPVFNIVPLEAIDQIKVVTSGFSAEYQGAGLENYNLKSGTNQYHGSIFAYFRNTAFDAWSFSSKPGGGNTQRSCRTVIVNEFRVPSLRSTRRSLGFAVGGPVKIPFLFNGHDKLFFYATYDKFRSRLGANPVATTIPTTLMRQGNFQELISCANATPADSGTQQESTIRSTIRRRWRVARRTAPMGPCRYQYGYGPGASNGATVAIRSRMVSPGKVNVIPASQLSPITQYMQKFLPDPTIATDRHHSEQLPRRRSQWLR